MALGLRVYLMRRIQAVLSPMAGSRATGQIRVRATGGNVTLPKGSIGTPIILSNASPPSKAVRRDMPIFVTADTTVTSGGVLVPASSVIGGARHNLPVGAEVRWDPALTGIELVSTIETAWTGGLNSSGEGSVRTIVGYEDIPPAQQSALFLAQVLEEMPAIVIAWKGTGPAKPMGNGKSQRSEKWELFVACARRDGATERGNEGLFIVDLIEAYLTDRGAVDGGHFSDPPTQVMGADRVRVTSSSYVYKVMIETHNGIQRIDARSFADWIRTKYDLSTAETPPLPVVEGAIYKQDGTDNDPPP